MSNFSQERMKKSDSNSNHPIIQQNLNINSKIIPFIDLNYELTNNPLSEIENSAEIIIRQEIDHFEFISGFERNISYHIFGVTSQGYKYLFKCIENTECLMRWLCPTAVRKLEMNIMNISSNENNNDTKPFANLLKPYKCPFFYLSRPEIYLTLKETNENIGKIRESFAFCDSIYEIYDDKDNIKYLVNAKFCQCGLLCANSICGKIGEATFNIINPETKEEIGNINKKSPFKSEADADKESYKIIFPKNASINDKLLIIALGLMIDYQYFEIGP